MKAKVSQKQEAERKRKAEERELEKKKAEMREAERKRKAENKEHQQVNKENSRNGKYRTRGSCDELQQGEISNNECTVCFGAYKDDLMDGELHREWIQCTNESCGEWMHVECLSTNDAAFMCVRYVTIPLLRISANT